MIYPISNAILIQMHRNIPLVWHRKSCARTNSKLTSSYANLFPIIFLYL